MTQDKDTSSAHPSDRHSYSDIGSLICLFTGLATWRLLNDYGFPALGQGVKAMQSLILG